MTKLVFRPIRKITHVDWLLNGPVFHNIGPVQCTFYFGLVSFGGRIVDLILMKFEKN